MTKGAEEFKSRVKKAGLYSLIPGGGQFFNQQVFKATIFFNIFLLFLIELSLVGFQALQGFVTLGTTPRQDHSLFLLIEGVIQLIIIIIFIIFYIINIYDARRVARISMINKEKVNYSAKSILENSFINGYPYWLTIFSYIFMLFTIVFPVIVTVFISFTNYDFYHIPPANLIDWVGLDSFKAIFSLNSYRGSFFNIFGWTIIWTIGATTLQLVLGIFNAVVLNASTFRFKRLVGVILLLPWAVPAFITIMSFSNIFNDSIGAINTQVIPFLNHLPLVEISRIAWKTDPFWTKTALIMIQGWLGYPYIFTLTSGLLQSIPNEWYEAAVIDGASAIQKFRFITFPHILSIAAPVFITQYTGNFNKFSVIYLFNEGGPGSVGSGAGSTDILVSWIYKLTTGSSPQYNIAATVTIIISLIVVSISLFLFKKTNAFKED